MRYEDFTSRDTAYKNFVKMRKKVLDSIEDDSFADVFSKLCGDALDGNCVAEDCLAYFFNKGIADIIQPNFEFYMFWQILAGANGNEFALEKIEFFLKSALDEIVDDERILTTALRKQKFTEQNALFVISHLLCVGIIDKLNYDAVDFVKIKETPSLYSNEKNRPFIDALNQCLPEVIDYLMA